MGAGEGWIVDARIVPVAGVEMVVVLRVPADHGHLPWRAEERAGVVEVHPPACPFAIDWRVKETGHAGRVSGPLGGEPIGIHPD